MVVLDRANIIQGLHKALTDFPADDARVRMILDLEQSIGTIYLLIEDLVTPSLNDYQQGVKIITRQMQRQNPKAKLTSFVNRADEVRHEVPEGVNEVLMIGKDESVLEGLSSNFFAVKDGMIYTANQGVLSGITRQMVLDVIREEGIPIRMDVIKVDDLPTIDEAFITSASRAVLPVTQINGLPVGSGQPGSLTYKIDMGYQALMERNLDTV